MARTVVRGRAKTRRCARLSRDDDKQNDTRPAGGLSALLESAVTPPEVLRGSLETTAASARNAPRMLCGVPAAPNPDESGPRRKSGE